MSRSNLRQPLPKRHHLLKGIGKKKSSGFLENQTIEGVDAPSTLQSASQPTSASQSTIDRIGAGNTVADLIRDLLQGVWYLGIDVGTTGISAVLVEQLSGQLYPVYWSDTSTSISTTDRRFRLPAVISLVAADTDQTSQTSGNARTLDRRFAVPMSITQFAGLASIPAFTAVSAKDAPSLFIQDIKPYLKLGIPYQPQTQQWEPVLQKSDSWQMPLIWMQQALQTLLATLKQTASSSSSSSSSPDASPSSFSPSRLVCGALGMEASKFQSAIDQLAGVVIGYPSNWSDTYSFNLREAVLAAKLVEQPEQIFLVEDTIATLLSVLRQEGEGEGQETEGREVILHNTDWQGTTLILNAGATVTELALVHLPEQQQDLQYSDFHIRSLPFAGNAIDQDIVCYLLYPLLQKLNSTNRAAMGADSIDLQLDAVYLDSLRLEQFVLPIAGEPDLPSRYRLRQRLENSRSGQILLDAARRLKLAFQQQSRFTLQLGDRHLTILRQDLGSRVLLPYVQRLNRELNALLQQTFTSADVVSQVICTGGTASIRAIGRWLHEKFPNATIIQDTYAQAVSSEDYCLPSCSRVAYGLAALPLHPQVLDSTRHQYSDYLLLQELLQSLPDRAITFDEIMQTLEQRGIAVQTEQVRSHVLALLEGHLPPGLIPSEQDAVLFSDESLRNADFKTVQVAPLCQRQGDYYRFNRYQGNQLQRYLEMILNHTQQQLDQPYNLAQLRQPKP